MAHVGLVLGAGGILGTAFHAGVLAAVEEATGWDPRSADLVVGTSGGATTGSQLRAGISAADLMAMATGHPLSDEGEEIVAHVVTPLNLPRRALTARWKVPQAPHLLVPALLSWPTRPFLGVAAVVARGRGRTEPIGLRINELHPDGWPAAPLWVPAVRMRDGKRVVFGRDDIEVPDLGIAVEASSAIPGYFAPVEIFGRRYADGGAWSATNADLAARIELDLVVVSAPKTAVDPMPWAVAVKSWPTLGRALHRQTLRWELGQIRDGGTPALCIEPDAAALEILSGNSMDGRRSGEVARLAFDATLKAIDGADLGPLTALPA